MKKNYIQPLLRTVKINSTDILAGSVDISKEGISGSDVGAKGASFMEDEEDF